MQGIQIDMTSSLEKIDDLYFVTYTMNIDYPNKMKMTFLFYSRLFDGKDLSINTMYSDEQKGKQMKEAWLASARQ